MKNCYTCKESKNISEFNFDKIKKDKLSSSCTVCIKARSDAHYQKNKSETLERQRAYYHANKEKVLARQSRYHFNNQDKRSADRKERYINNKEHENANNIARHNHRMKNDPLYRFKQRCRTRVYLAFTRNGYTKRSKTFGLVGCTFDQLVSSVESKFTDGMSWDNYGEWHLDHIIPFAAASTIEQVEALCHYTNLQPLWASDNLRKAGMYCEKSASAYLDQV